MNGRRIEWPRSQGLAGSLKSALPECAWRTILPYVIKMNVTDAARARLMARLRRSRERAVGGVIRCGSPITSR
jgi:hypothetical protein